MDFIQRQLDARGPQGQRAVVHDVVWGSRFRIHHAVADSYRVGRIALAGDAAHDNSPLSGQGMNTGIGDAVSLAVRWMQRCKLIRPMRSMRTHIFAVLLQTRLSH